MSMKTMLYGLVVTAMLIIFGTPVLWASKAAAAGSSYEVVQIWACEMKGDTTEEQVESIANDWLKAIQQMPGGAAAKVRVFFPSVVNNTGQTDFYFVVNVPTFTDWGKLWDAYNNDSPAAKSDEINQGKVVCPDNMLWEAHAIE
jgi:hypothetical protein